MQSVGRWMCCVLVAGCVKPPMKLDAGFDAGPPIIDAGCVMSAYDGGALDVWNWLQDPCGWNDVTPTGAEARYREVTPAHVARIADLTWADCGTGCESTSLALGSNGAYESFSTVQTSQGQKAYVSLTHAVADGGWATLRRVVTLPEGVTISALSARYPYAGLNFDVTIAARESAFAIFMGEQRDVVQGMDVAFNLEQGHWDFKQPWYDEATMYRYGFCLQGGLGSNPTSVMYLCPDQVEIIKEPGSRTPWLVPDSGSSLSAGIDNGLAVWSQAANAATQRSTIRMWRPGDSEVQTIAEFDGSVCGLGPRDDKLIGFRGESPVWCSRFLSDKRFFVMLPDAGVSDGPLIGGESLRVDRISAGKDYAASSGLWESYDAGEQRSFIILTRLSDWKMRKFWAPLGWRLSYGGPVVDDDYLYFVYLFDEGTKNGQVDRLFRYRLDQFDHIGEAFE